MRLLEMREDELLKSIFGPDAVVEDDAGRYAADAKSVAHFRDLTEDVLSTLTPREKEIVKMRFGLDQSGREHSAKEVGSHFNVTGERIRQIEKKAFAKLRHPSRSRRLRAFLDGTAMDEDEIPELDLERLPGFLTKAVVNLGERAPEGQLVLAWHQRG